MIGYLTTNNAFDSFVVMDGVYCRTAYTIAGIDAFRDALAVGVEQDLENWSGDAPDAEADPIPEDYGEVIATNDGVSLTVIDERLFAARLDFWQGGGVLNDRHRKGQSSDS